MATTTTSTSSPWVREGEKQDTKAGAANTTCPVLLGAAGSLFCIGFRLILSLPWPYHQLYASLFSCGHGVFTPFRDLSGFVGVLAFRPVDGMYVSTHVCPFLPHAHSLLLLCPSLHVREARQVIFFFVAAIAVAIAVSFRHTTPVSHRRPLTNRMQQQTIKNTTGGGTFVSKSGGVQHFAEGSSQGARGGGAKAAIAIPEEALPSGETLDRQLEAVTISESELFALFLVLAATTGAGEKNRAGGRAGWLVGCLAL